MGTSATGDVASREVRPLEAPVERPEVDGQVPVRAHPDGAKVAVDGRVPERREAHHLPGLVQAAVAVVRSPLPQVPQADQHLAVGSVEHVADRGARGRAVRDAMHEP